jgi:hypothetical protein
LEQVQTPSQLLTSAFESRLVMVIKLISAPVWCSKGWLDALLLGFRFKEVREPVKEVEPVPRLGAQKKDGLICRCPMTHFGVFCSTMSC